MKVSTQLLKPLKRFSNCIFSASLWGSKPHYIVFAYWEDEAGETKEEKVFKVNVTDEKQAIDAFVDLVQQLRRFSKYEGGCIPESWVNDCPEDSD